MVTNSESFMLVEIENLEFGEKCIEFNQIGCRDICAIHDECPYSSLDLSVDESEDFDVLTDEEISKLEELDLARIKESSNNSYSMRPDLSNEEEFPF